MGRGASGEVYKATNIKTLETVAIKRISISNQNAVNLELIEAEVNLLKKLSHPTIVEFKDYISTKNHVNIVLEFLEGGSLGTALKTSGPLDEYLVNQLVKQVLEGLIYIHSQNIIHRDIKAANLLIVKSAKLKLADFGLAIKNDEMKEHSLAGSPYWMAPEVIQEEGFVSPACDIWSLGATIIELITTKPPYWGEDEVVATWNIINDEHPPIPENITNNLKDFLLKCFIKDPSKRPTAKELMRHTWITMPSKRSYKNFIKQKKDLPSIFNGIKVAIPENLSSVNNSFDSKENNSDRNKNTNTNNNNQKNIKKKDFIFTDNIIEDIDHEDNRIAHIQAKRKNNNNSNNSNDSKSSSKNGSDNNVVIVNDGNNLTLRKNISNRNNDVKVIRKNSRNRIVLQSSTDFNNNSNNNIINNKDTNEFFNKHKTSNLSSNINKELESSAGFKNTERVFSFKPKSMNEIQLEELVSTYKLT